MLACKPPKAFRVVAALVVLRWTLPVLPLAAALGFSCGGLAAASKERQFFVHFAHVRAVVVTPLAMLR